MHGKRKKNLEIEVGWTQKKISYHKKIKICKLQINIIVFIA